MDQYPDIVDKFVKQLEYDKEYGKNRAFSSYAWKLILANINIISPLELQLSQYDMNNTEFQEFFDFIDGNGYKVLTERDPITGIFTVIIRPIPRENYDIK